MGEAVSTEVDDVLGLDVSSIDNFSTTILRMFFYQVLLQYIIYLERVSYEWIQNKAYEHLTQQMGQTKTCFIEVCF